MPCLFKVLAEVTSSSIDENSSNPLGESVKEASASHHAAAAMSSGSNGSTINCDGGGDGDGEADGDGDGEADGNGDGDGEADGPGGREQDKGDLVLVGKDVDRSWALKIDVVEVGTLYSILGCVISWLLIYLMCVCVE
jgi:hypothetical protein